jgi:hypothetical protein
VLGTAGVGASTAVGGARVGAGMGSSTVLHDPQRPSVAVPQGVVVAPGAEPAGPARPWRDAHGQVVPECRTQGRC